MAKAYVKHDYAVTGRDYVETEGGDTPASGGINYSTDEHEVGTWIDGSTLYEKTVDFGALPNTTIKSVAHGISDLKDIVYISAVTKNGSNQFASIPITNVLTVDQQVQIYLDATNINIKSGANYSAWSGCMVTIQYTKTE